MIRFRSDGLLVTEEGVTSVARPHEHVIRARFKDGTVVFLTRGLIEIVTDVLAVADGRTASVSVLCPGTARSVDVADDADSAKPGSSEIPDEPEQPVSD